MQQLRRLHPSLSPPGAPQRHPKAVVHLLHASPPPYLLLSHLFRLLRRRSTLPLQACLLFQVCLLHPHPLCRHVTTLLLHMHICTSAHLHTCNNSSSSFFHQIDRINKKQAVVLLCAPRVATSSMSKADALANEKAERKVREAACARKRAREALEHLIWVSNEESMKRQEEIWNGNNTNNGVAVANAKDEEEMEDGNFESLVRHLENTRGKEEVVDIAI
ncbi:hypothetical protein SLA2020_123430 [Shorea laevis]